MEERRREEREELEEEDDEVERGYIRSNTHSNNLNLFTTSSIGYRLASWKMRGIRASQSPLVRR